MRYLCTFAILMLAGAIAGAQPLTERRISSADIGTVVFMAPENWRGVESYDELQAASVYELSSRKEKFDLRLSIRYFGSETDDARITEQLDGYLKYAIAEQLEDPNRFEVRAARFAPRNHGIYARVYDRNVGKSAYPFYSHGARVFDDKLITFSLYSHDTDLSILRLTLDVVTSFAAKKEWVDAPDSYVCTVEQSVGYVYSDGEWQVASAKKAQGTFLLRRSKPGDEFADSSEWVFASSQDEAANSACDDDFIARGEFVCWGAHYSVFRMNTKTLRFIFAFLFGYHDVPPDSEPGEEAPYPQLNIGTCEAR